MKSCAVALIANAWIVGTAFAANYAFLSIGDWGGAQLSDQYSKNVYDVSSQMAITSTAAEAKFIINTGDNFYWCGIQNTTDPQIAVDYEKPYAATSLQIDWYNTLGNHEYGYNVQAQIDYHSLNPQWKLPNRYYSERFQLDDAGNFMTLLVLDTSPCVSDYRNDNPNYWDPCSTQYPTCSQTNSANDDFEGVCKFHENILSQNCGVQYSWLQATLTGIPREDWLVVVGHHPIDEVDVKDFTTLLQQRGFSIYLNGHTHLLNQYTIDGAGVYLTTGAGAMVNTIDQEHTITAAKLQGLDVTPEMRRRHRLTRNASDTAEYTDHTYQKIWTQTVAGFTLHTFNADFTALTTDFITNTGAVVHSFTSSKAGVIISQGLEAKAN